MQDRLPKRRGKSRSGSLADMLWHSNLSTHLSGEVWLFLLVSIADVLLTHKLLYHGGHVEANPVARFFIESWGPKGMVYFKFVMVGVVFVIVQVIAWKHVETARKVLTFAILAVGAVVAYSSVLYVRAGI